MKSWENVFFLPLDNDFHGCHYFQTFNTFVTLAEIDCYQYGFENRKSIAPNHLITVCQIQQLPRCFSAIKIMSANKSLL